MNADIRWQALLAVICIALVVSLLSVQVQTAGECSTRIPSTGGKLVEGKVGLPQRLNPLFASANPVDQDLVDLIFDGLVRYDEQGNIEGALAESWAFSQDGLTLTFDLRDGLQWHDGRPVTTADVAFTYGLLQDDSLPIPDAVRGLWQSVQIVPVSRSRIEFLLPQPYSPFIDATSGGILPAHKLQEVPTSALADHPFNRSPVGTGPFLVAPGTDWQRSGSLRLVPNPNYWRRAIPIDALEFRFFPNGDALANAFVHGDIQALSSVASSDLPQLAGLPGMRLFSSSAPRFTELLFNLTDSASPGVRTLAVRKALALGLDRDGLIDRALNGQGLPLQGPYLPRSWAFEPGLLTPYDFAPDQARAVLEESGWMLSEGQTRRSSSGEPLEVRLLVTRDSSHQALASNIAAQWSDIGVATEVVSVESANLKAALTAREFDAAVVDVESAGDPDLYDFWSQQAIVNGQNFGGWNNRRASEALEAARQLTTLEERRPYYQAFLRLYDSDLPALTLFQHVHTYGLSELVKQAELGPVSAPRDRYRTLHLWTLLEREVTVACPETTV